MKQEIAHEAVKASPPVAITSWAWLQGIPIDKLLGWATLAYVVLQTAYLLWKWRREVKRNGK